MTSISTRSMRPLSSPADDVQRVERFLAVTSDLHLRTTWFKDVGQGIDIPNVVLDDENPATLKNGIAVPGLANHLLLLRRKVRNHLVQEE